jgi:hypothetical protein
MIGTAAQVISKGTVEHAKDTAQEAISDLLEADVVQQIRKATRRELKHARKELEKAAKRAAKSRGKSKSRRPPLLVIFAAIGVVAVVVVIMKRRQGASQFDTAPDPFGEAVEEERQAHAFGQRPAATPGA